MTNYNVTLTFTGHKHDTVLKKIQQVFGEDAVVQVEKRTNPTTRALRLQEAESALNDAINIVSELRDEMQEWYDSIPENLQDGDKANQVQEAGDALEEMLSNLEDIDMSTVDFPGMF